MMPRGAPHARSAHFDQHALKYRASRCTVSLCAHPELELVVRENECQCSKDDFWPWAATTKKTLLEGLVELRPGTRSIFCKSLFVVRGLLSSIDGNPSHAISSRVHMAPLLLSRDG